MKKRATTGNPSNGEVIEKVKAWQASPHVHPLTCAADSNHALLVPVEEEGGVILVCPDCGRRQMFVPDVVTDQRTVLPPTDLPFKEVVLRLLQVPPTKKPKKP